MCAIGILHSTALELRTEIFVGSSLSTVTMRTFLMKLLLLISGLYSKDFHASASVEFFNMKLTAISLRREHLCYSIYASVLISFCCYNLEHDIDVVLILTVFDFVHLVLYKY